MSLCPVTVRFNSLIKKVITDLGSKREREGEGEGEGERSLLLTGFEFPLANDLSELSMIKKLE